MTKWIPILMLGMVANLITIFVLFSLAAHKVFNAPPECSIASFSPDLNNKQKAFCREWNSCEQK